MSYPRGESIVSKWRPQTFWCPRGHQVSSPHPPGGASQRRKQERDRLIIPGLSQHNVHIYLPGVVSITLWQKETSNCFFYIVDNKWLDCPFFFFVVNRPLTSLGAKSDFASCVHLLLWPDIKKNAILVNVNMWTLTLSCYHQVSGRIAGRGGRLWAMLLVRESMFLQRDFWFGLLNMIQDELTGLNGLLGQWDFYSQPWGQAVSLKGYK